jgi:hypothetical protein
MQDYMKNYKVLMKKTHSIGDTVPLVRPVEDFSPPSQSGPVIMNLSSVSPALRAMPGAQTKKVFNQKAENPYVLWWAVGESNPGPTD